MPQLSTKILIIAHCRMVWGGTINMAMTEERNFTAPPRGFFIRGVNIGGWLVAEQFITPYLFALTTCHVKGDFCHRPGQNLGSQYPACDDKKCPPLLTPGPAGLNFPADEWTLSAAFPNKDLARKYMALHWDMFVSRDDIRRLGKAGVTHVRVPVGYWITGKDIREGEPFVDGAWPFFRRLLKWCREVGMQVWPDLHGAPGSQNGFDNSGHQLGGSTALNWYNSTLNVNRTLKAVDDITAMIRDDGFGDVVTGFGALNEPFEDCDQAVLRDYYNNAYSIIRRNLGTDTAVYLSDKFHPADWNDGWWLDELAYNNTYLDTHPYHVFFERGRNMSPRQHIAYVCRKNFRDVTSCCWEDYPTNNTIPSKGISHIIGEWSAAFDSLPTSLLVEIMAGIAGNGTMPMFDRELPPERKAFLRNFVEAQMVTYEAASAGVSSGWFYWNFKMEGGAYAEWDFLRGVREGWIPRLAPSNMSSVDLFGTCEQIIFRTNDDYSVVHEYPDPSTLDWTQWQGWGIDDDLVISHGDSLRPRISRWPYDVGLFAMLIAIGVVLMYVRRTFRTYLRRSGYKRIRSPPEKELSIEALSEC